MTFLPVKAFCFEKPINPATLADPWGRKDMQQDPRFMSRGFKVFDLDELIDGTLKALQDKR